MVNRTQAFKSHCDNGHEFTEENTRLLPNGWRKCRTCSRLNARKYRKAKPRKIRKASPRKPPVPLILGVPLRVWALLLPMECGYETPCLVWTGTITSAGYGVVTIAGRQYKVHRLVYEAVNGPMPENDGNGLRIVSDHLCRNRACANPLHIDPVTDGVNVLRGVSWAPTNAAKTHCSKGHEFTAENTRITMRNGRECRTCRREWDQSRRTARVAGERAKRVAAREKAAA